MLPNYKKPWRRIFSSSLRSQDGPKIAVLMIDTPTDGRKEVPEKWRGLSKTFLF